MIFEALFVVANTVGNKIRGGLFRPADYNSPVWYNNGGLWKAVACGIMYASLFFLLALNWWQAALVTAGWYAFIIYEWGAWFDVGTRPPEYSRGGVLRPIYLWMGARYNQLFVDCTLMFLRGLFSLVLFGSIYLITWNLWVLALALPLAIFWTSAYFIDRVAVRPFKNWAEYYAGGVIAFFIIIGLAFTNV